MYMNQKKKVNQMEKSALLFVFLWLAWIAAIFFGGIGYVRNLIDVFQYGNVDLAHITFGMIVRVVGIFLPFIGAIAGWF